MRKQKPPPLENPVLHFGSDVYKCEADVRRSFRLGVAKRKASENDFHEGLRRALEEKIPTAVVFRWLKNENVPNPSKYAEMYDKALNDEELLVKLVKKETTWGKVAGEKRTPRRRTREATGRYYIHALAVWIYISGIDFDQVVRILREELDQVTADRTSDV
jgi:hypothetical protein